MKAVVDMNDVEIVGLLRTVNTVKIVDIDEPLALIAWIEPLYNVTELTDDIVVI